MIKYYVVYDRVQSLGHGKFGPRECEISQLPDVKSVDGFKEKYQKECHEGQYITFKFRVFKGVDSTHLFTEGEEL